MNPNELHGPVDRCVCRDVTFARMLEMQADGLTLDDIAARTGATANCSMCLPYARLALAARRPTLPVMSEVTIDRLLQQLGE